MPRRRVPKLNRVPRVTVNIRGAQELERKLKAMDRAVAGPLVIEAAEAGAEVIRAEAALRAPRSDQAGEHLADHVSTQRAGILRSGVEIEIGPEAAFFYGGILEVGSAGDPKRGGAGRFGPKPWMRPALDSRADDARDATAGVLRAGVLKHTER